MAIIGGIIDAFDGSGDTIIVIPATSAAAYEPYYLLSQITTVDGSGSDLDADLLDGYHASHFGTATQITNLQNTDVSLQSQISNLFAIGSRLVFRENFTGNGISTIFTLTGALQNAGYTTGSWSAANVLTALQADITDLNGKPIYDSIIPIYRDRINVSTINSLGAVTLDFIPLAGQQLSIWYWYQLTSSDVLSYYYREDHVAEMESEGVTMAAAVDVNATAFGNIVLRTTDNTVQKALDRLDDYIELQSLSGAEDLRLRADVIAISGDLQAQINSINVVGGTNVSVVEGPINTFTISTMGDISRAEVGAISGGLQQQIDAIVEESTTISSSGASILVTQNGKNFNLEVASAPVSNHNSLLGLQGNGTDYYHLNATQFASISGGINLSDYTLLSTTASISGGLNTRLTTVENNYATKNNTSAGTYNNVTVNEQGIVISGSNVSYTGASGIYGIENIPIGASNVTIAHEVMSASIPPIVSLTVPTSGDILSILGIYNRTSTGFGVVLSHAADISGYKLNWSIPYSANESRKRNINFVIDGLGDVPISGSYASVICPFNGYIYNWTLLADVSGSATLDVYKAYNAVPTNSNSITAAAKPSLTGQQLRTSTTLTGWTTTVVDGDIITVALDSASTCKRITLQLGVIA